MSSVYEPSTGWCAKDPATDLVGEPEPCGPNPSALIEAHRPNESRYKNAFDPLWSPNERFLVHAEQRLDFN